MGVWRDPSQPGIEETGALSEQQNRLAGKEIDCQRKSLGVFFHLTLAR